MVFIPALSVGGIPTLIWENLGAYPSRLQPQRHDTQMIPWIASRWIRFKRLLSTLQFPYCDYFARGIVIISTLI